jgi:IS5 family transposase
VHDCQALGAVLDPDNRGDEIWADSAYRSENIEAGLAALGHISQIHERAYRNHPLTAEQTASTGKSQRREPKSSMSLGDWVMTMGSKLVRVIGLERGASAIGTQEFGVQPQTLCVLAKEDSGLLHRFSVSKGRN